MKTSKRVLSLMLTAIMVLTTFVVAVPMLGVEVGAQGETINGISQTRIVPDGSWQSIYESYSAAYLNGFGEPTRLVIPGLTKDDNYVVQGMAYYPQKDWALITAYHNNEDNPSPSMVYCIDVKTGNFVAMFSFINLDGTPNTDHGGGIAISEHNLYYSCGDKDRSIAYIPLSKLDGIENEASKYRAIKLDGEQTFYETGSVANGNKTAYTAYCCYDQGVLWTGNFYNKGVAGLIAADYNIKAHNDYPSMVWGYKLSGETSEEEWANLTKAHNYAVLRSTSTQTVTGSDATMTYTTVTNGANIDITGSVTLTGTSQSELTATFADFYLTEGETYTLEFYANNNKTDMYMFAPNGKHMNIQKGAGVLQSDGTYYYKMTFTAGLKVNGKDSTWPTTQSTDGSFTGSYSIRFDQDDISSTYDFAITGFNITKGSDLDATEKVARYNDNCQGNPSYVIALPSDMISVQYATVDDGRLYLSRSYGTGTETSMNAGMSEYSQLSITDIDLVVPGTGTITFTIDANGTTRTVNDAYIVSSSSIKTFDFMPMAEGLCVIDDYVYMTFESATYKYYEDAGIMGNCNLPVDVVWKIDQYGLLGHERPDENKVTAYQKVMDVSEIKSTDEYIIVYESENKAEGNQNNILYALDTYGGYKGDKLPKHDAGTNANTLGSIGVIGHEITDYHKYTNNDGVEFVILDDPDIDDTPNIRWNLIGASTGSTRLHSVDLYNASYSYFYFDSRLMYMSTLDNTQLDNIKITNKDVDGVKYPGKFFIYNEGAKSYLWCNDGSADAYMQAYNNYYKGDSSSKYYNETEIPGTFHADALKQAQGENSGNPGNALPKPYKMCSFDIYKRITVDPDTMGGTGLNTELKAELQEDGTYTIDMSTYATSEAHKYLGESGYPTDFMFVLDGSGSMTNNNDYVTYNNQGKLAISRGMANDRNGYYVFVDNVIMDDGSIKVVNEFCKLDGHYSGFLINVKYWVGAVTADGDDEFYINTDGKFYWRDSQINKVGGADTTITSSLPVYRKATTTRLQGMKDTVNSFISKIDANAQTYNIEHRIAIATFGSDGADENSDAFRNTGIYSTLSGTTFNQYTANGIDNAHYAAAFYPSNHSNLKTIVNSITTNVQDPDTFANYGFEMAANAYGQQSPMYGGSGDRFYSDWTDPETGITYEKNANAVVILLTDGVPGKGGSQVESATNVANAAIPSAKAIKDGGGVIYSLQVSNASMDGFAMDSYMNGVSSNYPSANSLGDLGTKTASDYYVKAATDGSVDVNMVLDNVFKHIEDNYIDVGNSISLGTGSIVRQVLGNNFKLTSNSRVKTLTSSVYEDVLGNVVFGAETEVNNLSVTPDIANNTIEVTGFDYSSNHYVKNVKNGKKLNIRIDNVLPVDKDEEIMQISNGSYTAIYENAAAKTNNKKFKGYPNVEFAIPEYTYVLDYGMAMLDTDINGTLKSVSDTLSAQRDANGNIKYNTVDAQDTVNIVNNGLDMVYKIKTNQATVDKNYVLIQRDSGEYDWFQLNVVPASNVLFEEDYLVDGASGAVNWGTDGAPLNTQQSLTNNDSDTYGYDEIYATTTHSHSNGSAAKATVSSSSKRSTTKTTQLIGTGFDLMSACGPNTGIVIVKVSGGNLAKPKSYIVDTYYNGNLVNGNKLLCQAPIVSFEGGYGTYTVEATAAYLSTAQALKGKATGTTSKGKLEATNGVPVNDAEIAAMLADLGMEDIANTDIELVWFDNNSILNGGTGAKGNVKTNRAGTTTKSLDCYLDGFRVYNPLNNDSSAYRDTEKGATYINVIDSVKNNQITTGSTVLDKVAYVAGSLTEGTLSFANYENIGPQNELYLANGKTDALVLNITKLGGASRVQLGLRAVTGTATVKIGGQSFVINGATEQYYDVTNCVASDGTITIQNDGSGVLAVNNIKLTGGAVAVSLEEEVLESASFAMAAPAERVAVINGVVNPVVPEEPVIPDSPVNPDNGGDDVTPDGGDDNTGDNSGSGSFIEQLIAMIIELIRSIFTFLPVGEVM